MTPPPSIPSHLSPQEKRMIAQARRRIRWREAGNYDRPGLCRSCGRPLVPPQRFCGDVCEANHRRRFQELSK